MLVLRLKNPDGKIVEFPLKKLPAVAGRHERAAVRIDNPGVSREHARFFLSSGKLCVTDLNSSNGTFVNGKKVTRAPVTAGDEIRLGPTVLTLAGQTAAPRQAAKTPPEPRVEAGTPRKTKPQKTTAAAPALPGDGDVRIRKQVLQYHRIRADKKSSLLGSDFSQHHPFYRFGAILLLIALAVAVFFLIRWLTEETLPAPWESEGDTIRDGP